MKLEKEEGRGSTTHTTTTTYTTDPTTGAKAADTFAEVAGRGTTGGVASPEKAEEAAAAKSEIFRLSELLRRLNSYSSFVNVLTLMSLTWHLVHLGRNAHVVCSA